MAQRKPKTSFPYGLPVWVSAKLEPNRAPYKPSIAREEKEQTALREHQARAEAKKRQTASDREARGKAEKEAVIRWREARDQARAETVIRARSLRAKAKKEAAILERQSQAKATKEAAQSKRNAKGYAGKPGVKRHIASGKLTCLDCGPRPIAEFRVIKRKDNGRIYYESRCNPCRQNRCAARNQNLSPEHYRAMMQAAGGKCAICGKTAKLVLDHCHATGRVRGVLCAPCNQALAPFENDESVIARMADYLRYWRELPMTDQEKAEGAERERRRRKLAESSKRSKANNSTRPKSLTATF